MSSAVFKMIMRAATAFTIVYSVMGTSVNAGGIQFKSYWAPTLPEFADHNGSHTARASLIGYTSVVPFANVFADVGISGSSRHIETTRIGIVFLLDRTQNARIIIEQRNIVRVSGGSERAEMISLQYTF